MYVMGRWTIEQLNKARAAKPASGGKTYSAGRVVSKQHLVSAPLTKDSWEYIESLLIGTKYHGPQIVIGDSLLTNADLDFIERNGGL